MKHKGITHYSGEFASNINLGQPGFLFINASTNTHYAGQGKTAGTIIHYPKFSQFSAIKNVTDPGQGIATNGAIKITVTAWIGESGIGTGVSFHLAAGDIIFGPFESVKIELGTLPQVLAYIG